MLKNFKHKKIYTQILALSFVTVLVFLTFLIAFSKKTMNAVGDTSEYYTNEIIYQLEQTIYSNYNSLSDIVRFVTFQTDIQNFLLESNGSSKYALYKQMQNTLMNVLDLNSQIVDIVVMDASGKLHNLTENEYSLPPYKETSNQILLTSLVTNTNLNMEYFIMYAPIYSISTLSQPNSHIGTLYFIVDKNAFTEANSSPYTKTQSKLYLTDTGGEYFWSNNTSSYPDLDNLKKDDYKITTLSNIGLHIISIIEKEDTIYAILLIQIKYLILFLLCLLLIAVSWMILIRNIVTPLNYLVAFISSIKGGVLNDLKRTIHLVGYYEIDVISKEFNGMLSTINALTKQLFSTTTQLYEAEIMKKQSELEYLRSQINPHFLYNVLESIKGIAAQHHQPQIVTITKSLATIFKYSVKGHSEVPLKDELKITTNYISIQLFRFEDRFHVDYEISEECLDYLVPKMILQPIIENAIVHGIESCDSNAQLLVKAYRNENKEFIILVYNDGVPIKEELLHQIQEALCSSHDYYSNEADKGIGIYNVNNRIKLSYGSNYGLQILSNGRGTTVIFNLPINIH